MAVTVLRREAEKLIMSENEDHSEYFLRLILLILVILKLKISGKSIYVF